MVSETLGYFLTLALIIIHVSCYIWRNRFETKFSSLWKLWTTFIFTELLLLKKTVILLNPGYYNCL